MQVYLGSDHAGISLKRFIKEYLENKFQDVEDAHILDLGVFTNDSTDYPDIASEVCEKIIENKLSVGILICGSGIGMSIAANKRKGIRAVLASNELMAKMARVHNDANVLCMGERFIGVDLAKSIVDAFLEARFDAEERHVRRVAKLDEIANREDENLSPRYGAY